MFGQEIWTRSLFLLSHYNAKLIFFLTSEWLMIRKCLSLEDLSLLRTFPLLNLLLIFKSFINEMQFNIEWSCKLESIFMSRFCLFLQKSAGKEIDFSFVNDHNEESKTNKTERMESKGSKTRAKRFFTR